MVKNNSYKGNRNLSSKKSKSKRTTKSNKTNRSKQNSDWDSFSGILDDLPNRSNSKKPSNNNMSQQIMPQQNNLNNFNFLRDAPLIHNVVPTNQKYNIDNYGVNEKDLVSPLSLANGLQNFEKEYDIPEMNMNQQMGINQQIGMQQMGMPQMGMSQQMDMSQQMGVPQMNMNQQTPSGFSVDTMN